MGISNVSNGLRSGVCTSTTRPTAPYEGQVIYETDTDRVLVWNASAWVMPNQNNTNPDGLDLITTCTVSSSGGTAATSSNGVVTIGTNNTNIAINNAFSAGYNNYKIIVSGGVGSTVQLIGMYLGTSAPASQYWSGRIINTANNGTPTGNGINNGGAWSYAGQASTNLIHLNMDLINPFETKFTHYHGAFLLDNGGGSEFGTSTGMVSNTTSFTSFTLVPSANLTGGTIRVYGYRNS